MNKKRFNSISYLIACLVLLLGACSNIKLPETSSAVSADATEIKSNNTLELQNEGVQVQKSRTNGIPAQQQILELGTGEFIAQPAKQEKVRTTTDGEITLNFQDTDLREFIKVILSDVMEKNYVIDPKVGGKVTIETAKPIDTSELFPLLEKILAMNGAALVDSAGIYQILPKNQAAKGNISPSSIEKDVPGGYSVRIMPLRYIAAQEMQKVLEPFVAEGSDLRIDKKRNLIIVSGTQQELTVIQETIDIFDVDWLRGMSVGLYPLDYVDPKTMKTELDSIVGAVEGESGQELLGGLVRTVPIERLNSILLISSTPAALREVEIWIHRLDRPGDHAGKRLFVYNVQNAKATELGDILSHIFGSSSDTSTSQRPEPELAPGLTPVEIANNEPQNQTQETATSNPVSRTRSADSGVALPTGDAIEIIADDVRNALVVLATPQDYKMVELAIKKLDIVPLQVLIEASIIEVTLRDDLNYGVEWFFKNTIQRGGIREGRGTLDLGDTGLNPLTGFSYSILDTAQDVRVAINALEEESEVNVLSSPSLMVLDNQTAIINVGDEIPVPTRQSVSNIDPNSPTVNEIQFRQTGVTLTVTPRVNSSGLVTMEIKQEVSNAVSTTSSNIDAPTIQQRQIESVVAINSGETIVLGGLIQETETDSQSGVPGLIKIPLIGKLFGQTRDESRRTELLVLLTPRVVRNKNEARGITDEFRRKLKGLDHEQLNDHVSSLSRELNG